MTKPKAPRSRKVVLVPLLGPLIVLAFSATVVYIVGFYYPGWAGTLRAPIIPTTTSSMLEEFRARLIWSVLWVVFMLAATATMAIGAFYTCTSFRELDNEDARSLRRALLWAIPIAAPMAIFSMLILCGKLTKTSPKSFGEIFLFLKTNFTFITVNHLADSANTFGSIAIVAVLLPLATHLWRLRTVPQRKDDTSRFVTVFRHLLTAAAIVLVLGSVTTEALYCWSASVAPDDTRKALTAAAGTLSIAVGMLFSTVLASAFLPTWWYVRALTVARARAAMPDATTDDIKSLLAQNGLMLDWREALAQYAKILAPLLVALGSGPVSTLVHDLGK